jgi:hypothetical protein
MKFVLFYAIMCLGTAAFAMEQSPKVPSLKELCLRAICQRMPVELIEEIAAFKRNNMQEATFLVAQEKERKLRDLLLKQWQLQVKFKQMGCDPFGYPLESA